MGKYPIPTIGAFILDPKDNILLVKSYKWLGGVYTIPGGKLEEGEKMTECLVREVKEEVGLDVWPIKLIHVAEFINSPLFYKKAHFIFLDWLCRTEKPEEIEIDNKEINDFLWIKPAEVLKSKRIKVEPFALETIKKIVEKM